jgi:Recombination endonuclease VII
MSEETRTKVCNRCKAEKSWDDFSRRSENRRPPAYCKICTNEYKKQWITDNYQHVLDWNADWRKKHAEKLRLFHRRNHLKRKYGMTLEQYEALFQQQEGKCAICREREPEVVDHDHTTKEIRGLLCHPCNKGLGMFRENKIVLMNAALYLTKESKLSPSIVFPNLSIQIAN